MKYVFGKYPKGYKDNKIKVKFDYWDIWNLDAALTPLLVAALKHFRENYIGVPWIENEDVPEHLRTHTEHDEDAWPSKEAYEWILNEMIFGFEWKDEDDSLYDVCLYDDWKDQANRAVNGRILFAKYFHTLWT